MNVEMGTIYIEKVESNVVYGWFSVKDYNDIIIEYELENGVLSFSHRSKNKKKNGLFSKWLLNKKELYTTFILNYLDEINKINDIPSFKGKLIEEQSYEPIDKEYTIFFIKYRPLLIPKEIMKEFL